MLNSENGRTYPPWIRTSQRNNCAFWTSQLTVVSLPFSSSAALSLIWGGDGLSGGQKRTMQLWIDVCSLTQTSSNKASAPTTPPCSVCTPLTFQPVQQVTDKLRLIKWRHYISSFGYANLIICGIILSTECLSSECVGTVSSPLLGN